MTSDHPSVRSNRPTVPPRWAHGPQWLLGVGGLAVLLALAWRLATTREPTAEASCSPEPKTGYSSKVAKDQGTKLELLLSSAHKDKVSLDAVDKIVSQIDETYAAVTDKHQACVMLFKTMLCSQNRDPASVLTLRLAENVPRLCDSQPDALKEAVSGGGQAIAVPPGDTSAESAQPPPSNSGDIVLVDDTAAAQNELARQAQHAREQQVLREKKEQLARQQELEREKQQQAEAAHQQELDRQRQQQAETARLQEQEHQKQQADLVHQQQVESQRKQQEDAARQARQSCRNQCDKDHDACVSKAQGATEDCELKIQNESNFIQCNCPNWPAGNFACLAVCQSASSRAQRCANVSQDREQRCDDERDTCRAGC